MNSQKISSVRQIIVRKFAERIRWMKIAGQQRRFANAHLNFDGDETPYGNDIDLEDDQFVLRDLEAEVYALTDQFNTEQGLSGARSA